MEKDTFYFAEGWLELVGSNNMLKMAKKKMLDITNREKIKQYRQENKIDFNNGDDIKKLYAYSNYSKVIKRSSLLSSFQ